MTTFRLAPSFLRDFRGLDSGLSAADTEALDDLLAAIVATPESTARFPSFYDPDHPTWLIRSGPFMVHYGFDERADEVVFLNLFRRR